MDTSNLTGESVPRIVNKGDTVLSGFINKTHAIEMKVEKTFGESTVNKILELVENASAKKAPTKIETVKGALFLNQEKAEEIKKAFRKYKPESLLILGTSDGMIEKIRTNLELPELEKTIYITDVATEQEMEEAKRMRMVEGKHVIPVPTFEIKKDFSHFQYGLFCHAYFAYAIQQN